jgi:hypothetical protein
MKLLSVKNWEKFQHYKDRDPPWIKLYRDTLTTEAWVLGSDLSRLLQLASTMLAARYSNKIPLRFDLIKRVACLDCNETSFTAAIAHLMAYDFLEIHEIEDSRKQSASELLATCSSEERREETEKRQSRAEQNSVGQEPDGDPVMRVFAHWQSVHEHPKAQLDPKRRRTIAAALKAYSEADVCESIGGYRKSPHHMGQNDRSTVYDDIEIFLRDAKHIEAGLRYARSANVAPLSTLTRRNVEAVDGWVPPEMRNAVS